MDAVFIIKLLGGVIKPTIKKMEKVMISQPMHGFTDEQIVETRNRFLQFAEEENLEVVNTYFQDEWYSKDAMTERGVVQIPLCFLAKATTRL